MYSVGNGLVGATLDVGEHMESYYNSHSYRYCWIRMDSGWEHEDKGRKWGYLRIYFSWPWRLKSSTSRCRLSQSPLRSFFLACRWPPSRCVFTGWREPWALLLQFHHGLNYKPSFLSKVSLPNTITLGIGLHSTWFWGDTFSPKQVQMQSTKRSWKTALPSNPVGLGEAWDFAFLARSQVTAKLLVQQPFWQISRAYRKGVVQTDSEFLFLRFMRKTFKHTETRRG